MHVQAAASSSASEDRLELVSRELNYLAVTSFKRTTGLKPPIYHPGSPSMLHGLVCIYSIVVSFLRVFITYLSMSGSLTSPSPSPSSPSPFPSSVETGAVRQTIEDNQSNFYD